MALGDPRAALAEEGMRIALRMELKGVPPASDTPALREWLSKLLGTRAGAGSGTFVFSSGHRLADGAPVLSAVWMAESGAREWMTWVEDLRASLQQAVRRKTGESVWIELRARHGGTGTEALALPDLFED